MLRKLTLAATVLVAAWPAVAAADDKSDCLGNKNLDLRIQACSALIQRDPKDAVSYYNRGASLQSKGDLDKAIADFGKAIELKPNYPAAYDKRALAYVSKGDYVSALADANKAGELSAKPVVQGKTVPSAAKAQTVPKTAAPPKAVAKEQPAKTGTGVSAGGWPDWAEKVLRN